MSRRVCQLIRSIAVSSPKARCGATDEELGLDVRVKLQHLHQLNAPNVTANFAGGVPEATALSLVGDRNGVSAVDGRRHELLMGELEQPEPTVPPVERG
jgi:hypothetical protein